MKKSQSRYCLLLLYAGVILCATAISTASASPSKNGIPSAMVLAEAVMCETIHNFRPVNPAVVFSISHGEIFCYSNFNPVFTKTHIFHKWYKRDKLIFTMRLTLSPPKWASFSSIKIRDEDKGPWRVDITDETDVRLQTLRFSIAD